MTVHSASTSKYRRSFSRVSLRPKPSVPSVVKPPGIHGAICPETIFEYLGRALCNGDCSLADGVRLMAEEGNAIAIDIGDAWWQDVDTPEMLRQAEEHFAGRSKHVESSPDLPAGLRRGQQLRLERSLR